MQIHPTLADLVQIKEKNSREKFSLQLQLQFVKFDKILQEFSSHYIVFKYLYYIFEILHSMQMYLQTIFKEGKKLCLSSSTVRLQFHMNTLKTIGHPFTQIEN